MSLPTDPALTIGLPVHNGGAWLDACLASLLGQTRSDFVLHIADNASTDATEAICRQVAATDPRVSYDRHAQNLGAIANFNHVAARATTPFFKWAAADDLVEPTFVERCLGVLEADPTVVLAMPRTQGIDESGEPVLVSLVPGPGQPRTDYADHRNTVGACNVSSSDPVERFRRIMADLWYTVQLYGVMRTASLHATGLHPSHYMGDHILLSELVLHGRFVEVDEVLFRRRLHPGQTSAKAEQAQRVGVALHDSATAARRTTIASQYPARLRLHLEGVRRAPLTRRQQLACHGVLARSVLTWAGRRVMGTAVERLPPQDE